MALDHITGYLGGMAGAEAVWHPQSLPGCRDVHDIVRANLEARVLQVVNPLAAAIAVRVLVDIDHFACRCDGGKAGTEGCDQGENKDVVTHGEAPG
jgi:hypothetical protein